MNIIEATKKALENGSFMTRTGAWWHKTTCIKPTVSSNDCYKLYNRVAKKYKSRWNPTTEDILADDWEVVS